MTMAPTVPKAGRRGDLPKPAGRVALERPHAPEHASSVARAMDRGRMPRTLSGLLRWYVQGWDMEVPDSIHKSEVWRDHGVEAQGGSKLGAPAHTDPFRRYLENVPSETDVDGWYVRPMHAALRRLARRYPWSARTLFAVAMSADWRRVADLGHWEHEMFSLFLMQALAQLWTEYRPDVVRLD